MIKKQFELVQNTPIIHFKPETSIRETELKPALNKFLAEKKNLNVEKFIKKYPFRVKVINDNLRIENIPKNLLYFGNMGGNNKKFVYADVKLEFFSFKKEVLDLIEENIDEFLFLHNFGMRKSKGFGSFSRRNVKVCIENGKLFFSFKRKEIVEKKELKKRIYYFECNENEWMDYLGYFYKFLRSGINEYKIFKNKNNKRKIHIFYAKPLIFQFACNNEIEWEKKRIKKELEKLNLLNEKRNVSCENEYSYKIVRDILGLSTEQYWYTHNKVIILKDDGKDEKDKEKIERYPSPIMFKPVKIGNSSRIRVYFFNRGFDKLKGKFYIKIGKKIKEGNKKVFNQIGEDIDLEMANLDIDKFLEFVYAQKGNINSFIKYVNENISDGIKIKNILNNIFNDLRVINE